MAGAKKLTRAEQKVQRPLQILDAAFEEFTRRGFTATRLEDIAARVGVTKGTVYFYFETKEKLFEGMVEHVSAPFQIALSNYSNAAKNSAEELEAFLSFLFDGLVDDQKMRELFRLMIAEGPKFPDLVDRHHEVFIGPVFSKIDAIVEDGVAKKIFRSKAAELAKIVMSPLAGALMFRLVFDDRKALDRKAVLAAHVGLIMRALT
ncbi:TetR/AcrR family transcriptional regulator [Agrobacterium tumefaciens]|uniref:TetR family transcriptional regulator n=1 Tax=Agrobacterium tumefaciens TaxID=358 RepID=A0A2L2LLB3_AGRTU|nr:TetR/AcrR family transcriptional regulator [Agrobacterium tumefaciens]AVH45018.1 TetR family transcriptional regulator [Agrobacterium tumefaciens]NSY98909.1 TetR/AcrR family transcriptional regulator [Agrobacterium tumefaciens]